MSNELDTRTTEMESLLSRLRTVERERDEAQARAGQAERRRDRWRVAEADARVVAARAENNAARLGLELSRVRLERDEARAMLARTGVPEEAPTSDTTSLRLVVEAAKAYREARLPGEQRTAWCRLCDALDGLPK